MYLFLFCSVLKRNSSIRAWCAVHTYTRLVTFVKNNGKSTQNFFFHFALLLLQKQTEQQIWLIMKAAQKNGKFEFRGTKEETEKKSQ